MNPNFCQFKTAYMIDPADDELDPISDAICEDYIFEVMNQVKFPTGWDFRGTDISGAAGYVILFDIEDTVPTAEQLDQVDAIMRKTARDMYDHVRRLPYSVLRKIPSHILDEQFNIELE